MHWNRLTGVPTGFADGTDDGGGALADGSVTTAKLADRAVTRGKIADGAVGSTQIASSSITASELAPSAVQIETENVVGAELILPGNTGVSTVVFCSSGYKATAGTWHGGASADRDISVINSIRTSSGTGWEFWFWNRASTSRSIEPGVACLRLVM